MTNNKLNPNWVTGFTDAEGCFYVILINVKLINEDDKYDLVFK